MIKFSWLRVRMLAGLLVVLALLAVAGAATGRPVWDDLWKELFWLVLGVALVTFLVEALLSNAQTFELPGAKPRPSTPNSCSSASPCSPCSGCGRGPWRRSVPGPEGGRRCANYGRRSTRRPHHPLASM